MENFVSIILGLIIGGIVVYFVFKKKKETKNEDNPALLMLQQQMAELTREVNKSLIDVAREQTKTNEATRQFITIADKLGDLEKTLKHQKQRGNWGEASLELILSNTLAPGQYKMQYEFKNKEVVDAVIITKEGIIPIDAKFSLDNYDRVVHAIDDRQREELVNEVGSIKVNTRNLIDYAYNEKKVIIISPTTFMAYLQSVLYGFKAFKIE